MFIVCEGIDGSGKSTLAANIAGRFENSLFFSEPTDGPYGRRIRDLLSGREKVDSDRFQKVLLDLFYHDRLADIEKNIRPALDDGSDVILDRYFYSTAAYQADDEKEAEEILKAYLKDDSILQPDLVFYLQIPVEKAMRRVRSRKGTVEVFEKKTFLRKVDRLFRHILKDSGCETVYLNAELPPEKLLTTASAAIRKFSNNE